MANRYRYVTDVKKRPIHCGIIFQEDECLRNDPTAPNIHSWWREHFGVESNFHVDWELSKKTQENGGDHFVEVIRKVVGRHRAHIYVTVLMSFDGYTVFRSTEAEASWWRECYGK